MSDNKTKKQLLQEMQAQSLNLAKLQEALKAESARSAQTEQEMQSSLYMLQNLLDAIPSPIFYKDAKAVYRGCNKAFEDYLGLSRDQIVGKSVYDLSPRDLADKYHAMDTELLRDQTPQVYESQVRYADGSRHNVIFHKAVFKNVDGSLGGLIGIITDITDRKQAEERLRQNEAQWQELFDDAPVGYHEIDLEGRVVRVNRTELDMLGYTAEEMTGQLVWKFVQDSQASERAIRAKLAGEAPIGTIERTFACKDGRPLPVLGQDRLLYDEQGKIRGIRTTIEDVSARKAVEAERERLLADVERRALQLKTAAQVAEAASSILSLDEMLPQVVELIRERFTLYYTGLFLVEDKYAVLRAGTGEPGRAMLQAGHRLPVADTSMVGWCISHLAPRVSLQVEQDTIRFRNPHLPDTRSEMALPLIARGQVIGALTIQSAEPQAFSEEDIATFQMMANQLANAIQNAGLVETLERATQEERRRAQDLSHLHQVTLELAREQRDISSVLDLVSVRAMSLLDSDGSDVWLWREDARELELVVTHEAYLERRVGERITPGEGLTGRAFLQGRLQVVEDYKTWSGRLDSFQDAPFKAAMAVPMTWQSRVIGVLIITRTSSSQAFTLAEQSLAELLAGQAASFIQNAYLFRQAYEALSESETLYNASRQLRAAGNLAELVTAAAQGVAVADVTQAFLWQVERQANSSPSAFSVLAGWQAEEGSCVLPAGTRYDLDEFPAAHAWLAADPIWSDVPSDGLPGDLAKSLAGGSMALLPLWAAGRQVAALWLLTGHPHSFAEREKRACRAVAEQLAIAVENVRLFEQAQRRAEELSVLNVLAQALTTRLSIQGVADEAYRGASRLLDTENFYISLYNDKTSELTFVIEVVDGAPPVSGRVRPMSNGLTEYVIRTRKSTLLRGNVSEWRNRMGIQQIGKGAKCWLGVPLVVGDRVLGTMAVQSYRDPVAYDEHDEQLLVSISGPVAIAIQNAYLFEETRTEQTYLSTLYDISRALSGAPGVHEVAQVAVQSASYIGAQHADLVLFDVEGQPFFFSSDPRWTVLDHEQTADLVQRLLQSGVQAWVVEHGEAALVRDAQTDERWTNILGPEGDQIRSALCIPLVDRQSKVIGRLSFLHADPDAFAPDLQQLAQEIAARVTTALEVARLFQDTRTALSENKTLFLMSRALAGVSSIQDVLDAVLMHMMPQDADRASLLAVEVGPDGAPATLQVVGFRDLYGEYQRSGARIPCAALPILSYLDVEPWVIENTDSDPRLDPVSRATLLKFDIVATILTPLRLGNRLAAVLTTSARQPARFSTAEVRLLQNAADHIIVALEGRRLFEQTRAALNETDALYHASADLNEALTFDAVLQALRDHTILGQGTQMVSLHVFEEPVQPGGKPGPMRTLANWMADPVVKLGGMRGQFRGILDLITPDAPTVVADVANDPRLDPDTRLALSQFMHLASTLYVPLAVRGQWIGFVSSGYQEPIAPTEAALRRLMVLAGQVATVVQGIEQLSASQQLARREQVLREVTARVRSLTDPDAILRTAVRELGTALGRPVFVRMVSADQATRPEGPDDTLTLGGGE